MAKTALVAVVSLVIGLALGLLLPVNFDVRGPVVHVVRSLGTFTSPLLECEFAEGAGRVEYRPSKHAVEDLLRQKKDAGELSSASVFYRDLNNGPWFGINEHEGYAPASLLKVPLMMAYLREAEQHPGLLQKKLSITSAELALLPKQDFEPQSAVQAGREYAVDQLIERMIRSSDNGALYLLETHIDLKKVAEINRTLGMEVASTNPSEDYLPIKSAAAYYRILFNASYLSIDMSEKALALLSRTDSLRGIAQPLPRTVAVAHKFAERAIEPEGVREFHDCGIVYYPNHPYLLCVMTRGDAYPPLVKTVEDVSAQIYRDLDRRFKRGPLNFGSGAKPPVKSAGAS
ncbi:MAG: class A beta-lactamase-related serine hydrolase [Elusimicrobia bacterium]|nr:class A beta-lactamase-related serine hydrolase [Elusimicrobiota bacterium]